jgi:RimJ/RimL family protein N-acetyltransferase
MVTSHADELFNLFQSPELFAYITRTVPTDLAEFRKGIAFLEGRRSPDGKEHWLNWVSYSLENQKIVGKIEITLEIETRIAFLAYTTFKEFWGRGYAREGCIAVIRHTISDWNASKVVIEMDVRNTASVRLAESLGAERTTFKPRAQLLKGEWSDEYRYEIFPGNWKNGSIFSGP